MINRLREKQTLHDSVVKASANTYSYPDSVYITPDGEKNYEIRGQYPDVVVIKSIPTSSGRIIIEEIETEESITKAECDYQWKSYASLGCFFRLVVPKSRFADAQLLIKGLKVDHLQWYTFQNGQISFGP